jgi:hypothetical protein
MYQGLVKSVFKFIHCWLILRYEHKWQAHLIDMSTPNDKEHSETLQATEVQAVEAMKDKTLPPKISRPIGRDKAKRMKTSNTASNSTAFLQVLQNMRSDRQAYEERVEQATDATEGAISARSERKLAIQEQQLRLQERLVTLQEEREENLVMSLDLDKMTPWAKDFYLMKQKEIVARKTTQHVSNNEE